MKTTEVFFYEIPESPLDTIESLQEPAQPAKAKRLWELVRNRQPSENMLFFVENQEQAQVLDDFLWTHEKESFVPHGILACNPSDLHVLIAFEEKDVYSTLADTIVLAVPCSFSYRKKFSKVIDFAETFDPRKKIESRIRYKEWIQEGVTPFFVKET